MTQSTTPAHKCFNGWMDYTVLAEDEKRKDWCETAQSWQEAERVVEGARGARGGRTAIGCDLMLTCGRAQGGRGARQAGWKRGRGRYGLSHVHSHTLEPRLERVHARTPVRIELHARASSHTQTQ
eukprot:4642030-Pleurochrysis_carterae.AAC.2